METQNLPTQTAKQGLSPVLIENAVAVVSKYGVDFKRDFCPQFPTQDRGMMYPTLDYACSADTPTLVQVDNAYGKGSSVYWLVIQLMEVAMYVGVRDKFTTYQLEACARQLREAGYYVTFAEMMQFFDRFEQGRYETFKGYERPNPQVITKSFEVFLNDLRESREREYAKKESERLREEMAEDKRRAVPCPEHIKEKLEKLYNKFNSKR